MREVSPVSQDDLEAEEAAGAEEFVDAKDSQLPDDYNGEDHRGAMNEGIRTAAAAAEQRPRHKELDKEERRWRTRIEASLIKMTAEVAALREQLESNAMYGGVSYHHYHGRPSLLWGWLSYAAWSVLKLLMVDAVVLVLVAAWMRRRGDRRLEGWIRDRGKGVWENMRRGLVAEYLRGKISHVGGPIVTRLRARK